VIVAVQSYMLAESMSAESMAEFFDAAEQFESSSDDSDEVRLLLFCSSAVLDPRVGHTMDALSPFISVLRHSD